MFHDDLAPDTFHSPFEIFHKSIEFIIRNEIKLLFHDFKLGTFCKITQNGTFFHITKKSDPKGSQYILI